MIANLLNAKLLLLIIAILGAIALRLASIADDTHKVAQTVTPPPQVEPAKTKPAHLSGMEKTLFDKDLK
jgi:hypothetical protein